MTGYLAFITVFISTKMTVRKDVPDPDIIISNYYLLGSAITGGMMLATFRKRENLTFLDICEGIMIGGISGIPGVYQKIINQDFLISL